MKLLFRTFGVISFFLFFFLFFFLATKNFYFHQIRDFHSNAFLLSFIFFFFFFYSGHVASLRSRERCGSYRRTISIMGAAGRQKKPSSLRTIMAKMSPRWRRAIKVNYSNQSLYCPPAPLTRILPSNCRRGPLTRINRSSVARLATLRPCPLTTTRSLSSQARHDTTTETITLKSTILRLRVFSERKQPIRLIRSFK